MDSNETTSGFSAVPLDIPVRAQPVATENKMTERERFEEWAKKAPDFLYWNTSDAAFSAWCAAVSAEREACAKVCENLPRKFRSEFDKVSDDCAAEIRKRSNAGVDHE